MQFSPLPAAFVGGEIVDMISNSGAVAKLGLTKPLVAVSDTRKLGKRDMKLNDALPAIEVDPETYAVRADGVLLTCEPAKVLPMAQRYFLF